MLRLFVMSLVLLSVAIATVTVNCSPTPLNPDCTYSMQFVQLTVTAVDALNNPVTDLDIVVEVTRTGELLDVMQSDNLRENGEYVIFDDGFRNAIPPKIAALGEALEVTGTGSSGDFAAQFEVSVDVECRCHVFKLSGPDTVTVDLGDRSSWALLLTARRQRRRRVPKSLQSWQETRAMRRSRAPVR